MAEPTIYRVKPRENGWAVEKDGADRASRVEETKAEAVKQAKEFAKNHTPSHVVVYREDGTLQDEFRYDEDGMPEGTAAHTARKALRQIEEAGGAALHGAKVQSEHLMDRVKALIDEGNVRRIILKKEGRVLVEFPLSVGIGGAAAAVLVAPMLAAVGAIAALVSEVEVVVERTPDA